MVQPIRPANKPATETEPEMTRRGKCNGYKCECAEVESTIVKVDWECCTREKCGHTTFVHGWVPVTIVQ